MITVLETQMRLQLQEGRQFGKSSTTDISDLESPEWIGRQFKSAFAAIGSAPIRLEMYSRGTRAYRLSDELLAKAISIAKVKRSDLVEVDDPRAFCDSCTGCDYQEICELRPRKQKADSSPGSRTRSTDRPAEKPAGSEAGLH